MKKINVEELLEEKNAPKFHIRHDFYEKIVNIPNGGKKYKSLLGKLRYFYALAVVGIFAIFGILFYNNLNQEIPGDNNLAFVATGDSQVNMDNDILPSISDDLDELLALSYEESELFNYDIELIDTDSIEF